MDALVVLVVLFGGSFLFACISLAGFTFLSAALHKSRQKVKLREDEIEQLCKEIAERDLPSRRPVFVPLTGPNKGRYAYIQWCPKQHHVYFQKDWELNQGVWMTEDEAKRLGLECTGEIVILPLLTKDEREVKRVLG